MHKIIVFAGTTEGRQLSEWLCAGEVSHVLCVATEYGEQVLKEDPFARVHRGRLDCRQMEELMRQEKAETIVDATHPFAREVTENIQRAAKAAGAAYLRLDRNQDAAEEEKEEAQIHYFEDTSRCEEALRDSEGRILLTTGSKELAAYCRDPELKERLVVRVLPGRESIAVCEELGIPGSRIIAMQGPFSAELNLALIRAYDIRILVSKASGQRGGFAQKAEAAAKAGIPVYVIGRPENASGMSFAEVCRALEAYRKRRKLRISLIGCGMGQRQDLTVRAEKALAKASLVFGAGRLLRECKVTQETQYPYYLAADILPVLKEKQEDAAVLFSGDSGFYSGAAKMYEALTKAVQQGELFADIEVYPGISSVSALSAAFGVSWEDAALFSTHGKGGAEVWGGKLLHLVRSRRKTFLLLSGVSDLRDIARLLMEHDLEHCRLLAGRHLSGENEALYSLAPKEAQQLDKEGLYSVFILNDHPVSPPAVHGLPDAAFVRGKVPMTKEEIREIVISKLRLRRNSIVYDIGSGTGSIAVEMARMSPEISVYALERNPEGISLIRKNAANHGLCNLTPIQTEAPEGLSELPAADHAFIGGSGGHLMEIIQILLQKNPKMRIAATAVSLETLQELSQLRENPKIKNFELICVSAARAKERGAYHMLQGENPVWICSFGGEEYEKETDAAASGEEV